MDSIRNSCDVYFLYPELSFYDFGEMALVFSSHHSVLLGISQSSFQIHKIHMIRFRCRNNDVGLMSGKQNSGRV